MGFTAILKLLIPALALYVGALCLSGCGETRKEEPADNAVRLKKEALAYYRNGSYDSSIYFWNKLFEVYKARGQWDSLYDCAEKYIISHSRIFKIKEGNIFLDTLEGHLANQKPVDSLELSKVWVRRSEMLYADAKLKEAVDTLKAVLALRLRHLPYPHPYIADAYDYLQITTGNRGSFWESASYGEKGIKVFKDCIAKGYIDESSNLPWVIGNTGDTYNQLGDYDRAIVFLEEAHDSLKKPGNPVDSWMYYKMLLGGSYQKKGDYRKAITIFEECVDTFKNTDNRNYLAENYARLALCYKDIGLTDQMLSYARKQYEVYEEIHGKRGHIEQVHSSMVLAECLMAAHDPQKASPYIGKALSYLPSNPDSISLLYLDVLFLNGKLYQHLGEVDSALAAFNTVEAQRRKIVGDTNDLVALVLLEKARVEDSRGRHDFAARYAKEALKIFAKTRNITHPLAKDCQYIIANAAFRGARSKGTALDIINAVVRHDTAAQRDLAQAVDKSTLHLLELKTQVLEASPQSEGIEELKTSLASYLELGKVYQQFLNHSLYEGSNFATGTSFVRTIKKGFVPAARLYELTGEEKYLQLALDFSEQSRTGSIRLALQHYQASRFANVPDSVTRTEEQLRIDCAQYEKLLMGAAVKDVPQAQVQRWSDSLMSKKRSYSRLLEYISLAYPEYYQLKLSRKTATLGELQAIASKGKTDIVEYIVSGNLMSAFVFTGTKVKLKHLELTTDSLVALVNSYRNSLEDGDARMYSAAAARLYKLLVQPLEADLAAKEVCIIPDELLHYISFEALLSTEVPEGGRASFKGLPYAIYDRRFRYAHSATVLAQQQSIGRKAATRSPWLAMAPGFDKKGRESGLYGDKGDSLYSSLLKQPWAVRLASELKKMVYAVSYTGRKATEERYNEEAKRASVVYIGTHAFPDDTDPMQSELVFTRDRKVTPENDGFLHAYEIYRTPLNADLVVLGGCETGHGQLKSGEGVISLASGFAYAGCPSMVMTLWQIDDQQSAALLKSFFSYTKDHKLSEALTKAKLDYLKARQGDELYNPLYWSGLVSIGSDDFIESAPPRDNSVLIIVCTLAAVATIILFYRLRKGRAFLPLVK